MKLVDLSHPITDGMPAYPGDPTPSLTQAHSLAQDGFSAFFWQTGLHAGTHIDSPSHLTASAESVGDAPLAPFCGPARVLDVRGCPVIAAEAAAPVLEGEIVLLYTGFDAFYGQETYYTDHPVLSEDFARRLIDKRVRLLGLDMPSPDRAPFPIHRLLLSHGVFLLENLTGLSKIAGATQVELFAFPLRLAAEGSPVRAVAQMPKNGSF